MKDEMHLISVDTKCKKCKYRNKGNYKLDVDMDIICCGNCGEILTKPDSMSKGEQKIIKECVKQAIKDEIEEKIK